ncbi:MAG: UDP-N-acetylglucosamine 1-carboxyvinyltransferase [Candidatus Magasanikbacteria bacterium]|nr:UDP-N-acetylglucosamine 1-carboxyvinyltransferase [Candidatus Magasanikbacteria bacterium]
MSYVIINGGKKLKGAVETQSAKNSAVALLCAAVMIKGKTTLSDMPQIEEVSRITELLQSIGVKTRWVKDKILEVDASGNLKLDKIDVNASEKTRASIFFWGALAARVKSYKLPKSGGCHLGERTVRPHWYALKKLGVKVESTDCYYLVKNSSLKGAYIVMYESGDTTTENVIMAAVLAKGKTTIKMASANYQVQDLCYFLIKAGAKIKGVGSTTLEIDGVEALKSVDYPVMPDPIVAMTFISAAITTGSNLTIKNCPLEFLELELCKLEVMGQKYNIKNERLSKNDHFKIVDIEIIPGYLTALPDKVYGRPFPGLNIDNLPLFIPVLTQAKGRTLVHDWAFENRAVYALELQKLAANVTLLDSHRLWVEGPTKFTPNELMCPPALRPAVNVLICMLAASGKSILRNTYVIDRGYENLYAVLNSVGADIKIVKE